MLSIIQQNFRIIIRVNISYNEIAGNRSTDSRMANGQTKNKVLVVDYGGEKPHTKKIIKFCVSSSCLKAPGQTLNSIFKPKFILIKYYIRVNNSKDLKYN